MKNNQLRIPNYCIYQLSFLIFFLNLPGNSIYTPRGRPLNHYAIYDIKFQNRYVPLSVHKTKNSPSACDHDHQGRYGCGVNLTNDVIHNVSSARVDQYSIPLVRAWMLLCLAILCLKYLSDSRVVVNCVKLLSGDYSDDTIC